MLTGTNIVTMLPVQDTDRAARFYSGALGLREIAPGPDGTRHFEVGGHNVIGLRPLPDAKPSENTALSFEVSDIAGEVGELEGRGVTFLDYDTPELHTEGHIATFGGEKAAWFTDSEGNYLCLHQPQ
ncbi:VOC family protein [Amycolatopsis pithecellobii]|uniref:VOC family protein n=1 Tax=Amycolatopsis pithecellobii TaxID=664692 RepID=A0A6N7ZAB1_9PSEU|nr:VOC family protein [Amycolatopsis pithecellobii]MTD58660.1 VOC family protein [Amycolatopsis pithecellobii]